MKHKIKFIFALLAIILLFSTTLTSCMTIFRAKQLDKSESLNIESSDITTSTATTTTKSETTTANTTKTNETTKKDGGVTVPEKYKAINYENMKAMWLSQFDLSQIYSANNVQVSKEIYSVQIKQVVANCKAQGINTLIVQMRPNADSMYPSQYYPPSIYVVGAYGNSFLYDPIEILIDEAHKINLSVHAWINPLRGVTTTEIASIDNKYLIKQWYNDNSKMGKYLVDLNSRLYLNPTYSEVRKLIIDGATEIFENYNIDGLHMDDYFYPTQAESFDSASYTEYKANGGDLPLADYRRAEINQLVKGLFDSVKAQGSGAIFGISPAGNYDTTYNILYADILTWCKTEGYIDYICPQAYFGFEHETYNFVKICTYYNNLIKTDSVKLIIGMSLGKALNGSKEIGDQYAGTGKNEWINNKDILKRSLEYTKTLSYCSGVSYFCYQYFYIIGTNIEVPETKMERDKFIPILKTITW